MTLYLFGGLLVDADAIIAAVNVGDETQETELVCRGYDETITLGGPAKVAFDSWAQSIEPFLLKASEPDLATVHSHMHSVSQEEAWNKHEHPHERGHHHGDRD